jgi:hypothetical protein
VERAVGALVVTIGLLHGSSCTCRRVREDAPVITDAVPTSPTPSANAPWTTLPTPSYSIEVEKAAPCDEPTQTLTAADVAKAKKLDLGTWKFEKGHVGVYSWSYAEPGLLVFGDAGETATIRAKMQSAKPAAQGNQGIALCVRDDMEGAHHDELYFARYFEGQVELLSYASFGGYGKGRYGWNRLITAKRDVHIRGQWKLRVPRRLVEREVISAHDDGATSRAPARR